MVQSTDLNFAPNISGTTLRTELNDIIAAIATNHSGATRPSYLTGTTTGLWVKIVSSSSHELYYFDGTDDLLICSFNLSSNVVTFPTTTAAFANTVLTIGSNYTITSADNGKIIGMAANSGNLTVYCAALASLPTGFYCIVQKQDVTANLVTIDPNGTEMINGITTKVLGAAFEGVLLTKQSNTNFYGLDFINKDTMALKVNPSFSGTVTVPYLNYSTQNRSTNAVNAVYVDDYYARKDSPQFSGVPLCPDVSQSDSSAKLANTFYVRTAVAASGIKNVYTSIYGYSGTYWHVFNSQTQFFEWIIVGGGGGGGGGGSKNRGNHASTGWALYGLGGGGAGGAYGRGYFSRAAWIPKLEGGALRVVVGAGGVGGVGEKWGINAAAAGGYGGQTKLGADNNLIASVDGGGGGPGNFVFYTIRAQGVSGLDFEAKQYRLVDTAQEVAQPGKIVFNCPIASWGAFPDERGTFPAFGAPSALWPCRSNPGAGGDGGGIGVSQAGTGSIGATGIVFIMEYMTH